MSNRRHRRHHAPDPAIIATATAAARRRGCRCDPLIRPSEVVAGHRVVVVKHWPTCPLVPAIRASWN